MFESQTDEIHSKTRKMGVKLKAKTLMRKWKSCGRDLGDVEATWEAERGGVRATYIIGGLISARLGATSQHNAGDASNKQPRTAETRRTVFNGRSTSQRAHVLSAGDARASAAD